MNIAIDLDGTLTKEDVGSLPPNMFDDRDYIDLFLENCTPATGIEVLNEYGIIPLIITGRDEARRELTTAWLNKYNIRFKSLIMAPHNYYLENGQVNFTWEKYSQLKLNQHRQHDISMAFDDKLCSVEILNQHGILTFLVQNNLREVIKNAMNNYGGQYV